MKPIHDLSDDEWLQLVQRAAALPDAPEALIRAALDLWPARQPSAVARAATTLRRVVAVLSFDSWAAPAVAAGMRALPSEVRQLLFTAMGRDIDLRIAPQGGRFALAGQVLGPDETGSLELAGSAGEASAALGAEIDALGEFRLDGVGRGTYRLTLRVGGDEIVLPPIEVGARHDLGDS
jgi:hypothetical protein